MKINPQTFFNFCATHTTLLRAIAEHGGEISEIDAIRLVRANPPLSEELPETAWRRLRELQILIPTEPSSELTFWLTQLPGYSRIYITKRIPLHRK